MSQSLRLSDEVRAALADGRPVVALETTLVAHGFPSPTGIEVAIASEAAVREAGAVPATTAVIDGTIRMGLTLDDLERLTPDARKLGPRDIAACVVDGVVGAMTAGGTLAASAAAGISFMGTGGIGGVHRGYPSPPDVSADLTMLARAPALVVSSGVKSLLDVPATMEVLETLGIPVLGYRTATIPLFYSATGGPPVSVQVGDAVTVARIAGTHWGIGGQGILVGQAPAQSIEIEELVESALADAGAAGVTGKDITPFVLAHLHAHSGGRTLAVNRDLIVANASLAAMIASAYSDL
jgi:pseudouridylate synthase